MTCLSNPAKTALLTFIIAFLVWAIPVNAQTENPSSSPPTPQTDGNSDGGWHVAVTPYIWFAGMNGTVGARGQEASVHASASDVLSYLNIGVMAAAEVRYNRVVAPVDFLWIKLSDDKGLPVNEIATSVKAEMRQTVLTPKIGYRVVDHPKIKVDALFGVRYWHLATDLSLRPTPIANGFSQSGDWVDAVAGGKFQFALTPRIDLTVAGDAGGGSARSDYQIVGLLGYKLGRRFILQGGWRYLDVNYRPSGGFVYDIASTGLLFGATINLK